VTAGTPGQAAHRAYSVMGETVWGDLDAVDQEFWESVAQAAIAEYREQPADAQQPQPAPGVHANPDALFDAWWDETYEPDEGDPVGAPDRHVPRDAFHAGWDHARALLAPNGVEPQPAPELAAHCHFGQKLCTCPEDCGCWHAEPVAVVAPKDAVAPELAAAMAESRTRAEVIEDMLSRFTPSGSGHSARVGQIQIARWRTRAGLTS
jgi:hypothetical protein